MPGCTEVMEIIYTRPRPRGRYVFVGCGGVIHRLEKRRCTASAKEPLADAAHRIGFPVQEQRL